MFLNTEKDTSAIVAEDNAAFCRLYEKYKGEMYRYSYSILKDHQLAEDTVQDAFVSILENAHRYIDKNEKAWIMRIVHNLSINRLKSKSREQCEEEIPQVFTQDEAWFYDAMELISDKTDRQIVVLYIDAGFRLKEIAELLGLTANVVSKRYRKTLKCLKLIFSKHRE